MKTHKDLYMNGHRNFTHNSKKMQTTQCPLIGKQINKSRQMYTLEHYSAIKMTYSGNKMDESQKHKSD